LQSGKTTLASQKRHPPSWSGEDAIHDLRAGSYGRRQYPGVAAWNARLLRFQLE